MDHSKPYQGETSCRSPHGIFTEKRQQGQCLGYPADFGHAADNRDHLHIPVIQGHDFYSGQRSKSNIYLSIMGYTLATICAYLIIVEVSEAYPTIWPG